MTEQSVPQSGAADLIGRKVRLTGRGYAEAGFRLGIRTITDDDSHVDGTVGCATPFGVAWVWLDEPDNVYAGVLLPERERILVYSWGVTDSSGGFIWAPDDDSPSNRHLRDAFAQAQAEPLPDEYGVLAYIHLAKDGAANMTDYIEGELQDAIALGLVGKIIGRY